MEDKNIKKYNELEEEYFSTCSNWTYDWRYGQNSYCLTWDFDANEYRYSINGEFKQTFKDIYSALDSSSYSPAQSWSGSPNGRSSAWPGIRL